MSSERTSYYGYPALKRPEWRWEIPAYFFTGGLAAGAYLLATLADLFGSEEDRPVSRVGRYVALASVAVSPLLLIRDLGRPERFINMMRIVKTRSPMSMGTYGLSGFSFFVGLGVLRQLVEDGVLGRRSIPARLLGWMPLRVSGIIGSLLAFFVSGYTGVLVTFTNVPLWARNRYLQAPLFITSALNSAIAAVSMVLTVTHTGTGRTYGWLERLGDAAGLGEAALIAGSVASLGSSARPLVGRPYWPQFWLGVVGLGTVFPMILRKIERPHRSEPTAIYVVAHLSVLLGGLMLRWVTVRAGQESAEDPDAYFRFARGRQ